eukprot:SAG11_NODE_23052_length_396_cov_0.511785_1_plen_98_part_00
MYLGIAVLLNLVLNLVGCLARSSTRGRAPYSPIVHRVKLTLVLLGAGHVLGIRSTWYLYHRYSILNNNSSSTGTSMLFLQVLNFCVLQYCPLGRIPR